MADVFEDIQLTIEDLSGNITNVGQASDTLPVVLESKWLDLGDAEQFTFIDQVFIEISKRTAVSDLDIELFGSNDISDATKTVSLGSRPLTYPINFNVDEFRFFKFILTDSNASVIWEMTKFTVFGEHVGRALR